MFVTVRFGENESRLFNINCRNEVLLYQIKKRCKMEHDETIELSDETGGVKNLRQNLNEYGYDYLKERETLILLRVDTCEADNNTEENDSVSLCEKTVFIPMLTNMTENQDFIDALNPRNHGRKNSLTDDVDGKGRKSKNKDRKKDKKGSNKPPPPKK